MASLLPSAQARIGDENFDHARRLRDQYREVIPNDEVISLQNRITMTTEMRVGLDSKRGLSRLSHARAYRRHAEETLHLVKTTSDRARDAEFDGPQDETYDEQMRRTMDTAEATYRCYLSSKDAFPTPEQASDWAKSVWPVACTRTGTRLSRPPDDLADRLTAVGLRFLIDVKAQVTPLVTQFYEFETGQAAETLTQNTVRARNLKADATFVNGENGLPYRHPIIQRCINVIWFGDRRGEGVRFPEFNPIPYEAIALVLTAIECCLDEWSNGLQIEQPFTYERYKVTYTSQVAALRALTFQGLNTRHCDPLHQLRRDFYDEGWRHAGVSAPIHISPDTRNIWPQDRVDAACQGLLAP